MAKHSPIGASSMYRWAQCPGSIRLSKDIKDTTSPHALEGIKAHELAEAILMGLDPDKEQYEKEMWDAVQVYVQYIEECAKDADIFLIEHGFSMPKLHPDLFGTADAVCYYKNKKLLRVVDYKHGQGKLVEVENNPQLKYYALGAIHSLHLEVKTVETVIIQPRAYHEHGVIRSQEYTSSQILEFQKELLAAVKETEKENAPLKAGSHCDFCKAAGNCPELQKKSLEVAKLEFSPTQDYEPLKLSEVLKKLNMVEKWAKQVREFAYREAMHGRCPPGWKLVEKRAQRKWKPDAEERLLEFVRARTDLSEDDLYTKKIKTPAQMDKILPAKKRLQMQKFTTKESSGTTLVEESDKRVAVKLKAQDEFDSVVLLT